MPDSTTKKLQKKHPRLEISTNLFFHSALISTTNLPLHKNVLISRPKRLQSRPLIYILNDPWIIQPNFNIRQSVLDLNKYQIKISMHFCPRALEVRKLLTICFWLIIFEKFRKAITLRLIPSLKKRQNKFFALNLILLERKIELSVILWISTPELFFFFFCILGSRDENQFTLPIFEYSIS